MHVDDGLEKGISKMAVFIHSKHAMACNMAVLFKPLFIHLLLLIPLCSLFTTGLLGLVY